ncbi:MAG: response regulator transcription factor [Myxococcales bacterium]|nr:response regulator transcription factor [Myxococcales bacterium]
MKPRILVIEDDHSVRIGIVRGLAQAGFDVEWADNGERGVELALGGEFALIVLDLMLPERDGFDLLESFRGRLSTPVIVLTARTDLTTRLKSFSLGAVDYQSKPFFIEELLARIRARLRLESEAARIVELADVRVNLDARTAEREGADLALTRHEFNILAYLLERPERAVSRRALAEHALPEAGDRFERTVDSHISRIRTKLGPSAAGQLKTVWGIGYRFDPQESSG